MKRLYCVVLGVILTLPFVAGASAVFPMEAAQPPYSIGLFFESLAQNVGDAVQVPSEVMHALKPYEEVMEKLNRELGARMFIPAGNEGTVYNNIKDLSLAEFERQLRADYQIALDPSYRTEFDIDKGKTSTGKSMVMVPYEIMQGLMPYQEILDKLNQELGADMFIPAGREQEVFDKIKAIPLDEFETRMRDYYKALPDNSALEQKYGPYTPPVSASPLPNAVGPIEVTPIL